MNQTFVQTFQTDGSKLNIFNKPTVYLLSFLLLTKHFSIFNIAISFSSAHTTEYDDHRLDGKCMSTENRQIEKSPQHVKLPAITENKLYSFDPF